MDGMRAKGNDGTVFLHAQFWVAEPRLVVFGGVVPSVCCSPWPACPGLALVSSCSNDCDPGQYLYFSTCTSCGAGYYSLGGCVYSCSSCSAGKYSSSAASSACTNCTAGQGSDNAATSCTACAVGSYSTGGTACTACSAGTYAAATGSTACVACAAGQSSAAGASMCTPCAAGQYSTSGGL